MGNQSPVNQRVMLAVAGNTNALRRACDAFESIAGMSDFDNDHGLLSLFEMLVLAKVWHDTLGHCGDEKRMQELLQDFISHTKAKGA
jgi:hypothetical protein|tara:strand:- start:528 stop:788 length:261 start_codon:yes stop_codon:yes gene_type:complete